MLYLPVLIYIGLIVALLILFVLDRFLPTDRFSTLKEDIAKLFSKFQSLGFLKADNFFIVFAIALASLCFLGLIAYATLAVFARQGFADSKFYFITLALSLLVVCFTGFVFVKTGVLEFTRKEDKFLEDEAWD